MTGDEFVQLLKERKPGSEIIELPETMAREDTQPPIRPQSELIELPEEELMDALRKEG